MEAVGGVFESGRYIWAPNVSAFEQEMAEFCGTKYAVGVGNGTDALVLSWTRGIGPGDEVIPPLQLFATVSYFPGGRRSVFVDIDADTYNMDIPRLKIKSLSVHGLYCRSTSLDRWL